MIDARLINDILNGEMDKYSVIVEKYHDDMFRYIYNVNGDVQQTEDLILEVFLRLYRDLPRIDIQDPPFRFWVYRYITKILCEKARSASLISDQAKKSEANDPQEMEINQLIHKSHRNLKQKNCQVMLMHFLSNLTPEDIGTVMTQSHNSVHKAIDLSGEKIPGDIELHKKYNRMVDPEILLASKTSLKDRVYDGITHPIQRKVDLNAGIVVALITVVALIIAAVIILMP